MGPKILYTTGAGKGVKLRGNFPLQWWWWCIKSCCRESEKASCLSWIQEGFPAEHPRHDSEANFQWNDSDSGPKVGVTCRKSELRCLSFPCFFEVLVFPLPGIPCFFERFPFFSSVLGGSVGVEILVFSVVFLFLVKKFNLVARAIRNAIHANRFVRIIRNWNPYFYSALGRFAWITRISDSRVSRHFCEKNQKKETKDRVRTKKSELQPGRPPESEPNPREKVREFRCFYTKLGNSSRILFREYCFG